MAAFLQGKALSAFNKVKEDFLFEDLPAQTVDPSWNDIQQTYGLKLPELCALKNARCSLIQENSMNKAAAAISSPTGLDNVTSPARTEEEKGVVVGCLVASNASGTTSIHAEPVGTHAEPQRHMVSQVSTSKDDAASPQAAEKENICPPGDSFCFTHLWANPLLDENGQKFKREKDMDLGVIKESKNIMSIIEESCRLKKKAIRFQSTPATAHESIKFEGNVLHFSGHGEKDDKEQVYDALGFEYVIDYSDKEKLGRVCWLSIEYPDLPNKISLQKLLQHMSRPQLVFVAACHSEAIGMAFVNIGVPHVIAIRRGEKVLDEASIVFCKEFYSVLFHGGTVSNAYDKASQLLKDKREFWKTKEYEKFRLLPLPENGGKHDVPIVDWDILPAGEMIWDQKPKGFVPQNIYRGKSKVVAGIYRLLHADFDKPTAVVITGDKGIYKSDMTLRALNYSFDRHEFKAYYCLDGREFAAVDASKLAKDLLYKLCKRTDSGFELNDPNSVDLDYFINHLKSHLSCSVLLLHKFDFSIGDEYTNEFLKVLYKLTTCLSVEEKFRLILITIKLPKSLKPHLQLQLPPLEEFKVKGTYASSYQYCMVVSFAPSLLSEDIDGHNRGHSFSKRDFVNKVQKNVLDKYELSASICTTPQDTGVLKECIAQSKYLVYFGVGIGYEYYMDETTTDSNQATMISCGQLPSIVVVCLKYGAESFAHFLKQSKNASEVVAILWISVDVASSSEGIFKVGQLLNSLSNMTSLDEATKVMSLFEDGESGVILCGERENTTFQSIFEDGDGSVCVKPKLEQSPPYNNILLIDPIRDKNNFRGEDGYPKFLWENRSKSELYLAAQDIQVFESIAGLFSKEEKNMISIFPDVNVRNRHRGVAFEVIKKYLSYSYMNKVGVEAVVAVDNLEKLNKFGKCLGDNNNFAPFFTPTKEPIYLTGKVLLWCDMQQLSDEVFSMIRQIAENKNYFVLLTFFSREDHENFKSKLNSYERKSLRSVYLSDSNEINANLSVCSHHYDDIFFDVVKQSDNTNINLKQLFSCLQDLIGSGLQVLGVYDNGKASIVVRVSISDVKALQRFFSLIMIDGLCDKLNTLQKQFLDVLPTDSIIPATTPVEMDTQYSLFASSYHSSVEIQVNPTKFAECFERAMARLENLTSHQSDILQECKKYDKVHLMGPAGCGKTFVAVHMIVESLRKKTQLGESLPTVVFITKTKSLCLHIVKLLLNRGIDDTTIEDRFKLMYLDMDHLMSEDKRRNDDLNSLKVKAIEFDEGMIKLNDDFSSKDKLRGNCFVIVDEAHHLFEIEVGSSNKTKTLLLKSIIDDHFDPLQLLLLSDMSQSSLKSLTKVDELFGTEPIVLKEVVRSSQNVMDASKCYAVAHLNMKSQHSVRGFPIKTFMYRAVENENNFIPKTLGQLEKALLYIKNTFKGLEIHSRLAILVPNEKTYLAYKDEVEHIIENNLFNGVGLTTANKRMESYETNFDKGKQEIVYDTIDNFDGLESLIVIGLALDQASGDNGERSACYRLITRAQMLLMLVGPVVKGGYFEWLQFLKYDKESSAVLLVDSAAAQAIVDQTSDYTSGVIDSMPANKVYDGGGKDDGMAAEVAGVLTEIAESDDQLDEGALSCDTEVEEGVWIERKPKYSNHFSKNKGVKTDIWDITENDFNDQVGVEQFENLTPYFPLDIQMDFSEASRLGLAAYQGDLEQVKHFVRCGDSVEEQSGHFRWSPVGYATVKGHLDVLKYLIEERGANHNAKFIIDHTPIHVAAERGQLEALKYLIDYSVRMGDGDIGTVCCPTDTSGNTPLHYAARHGHVNTMKYLIETCGVDHKQPNRSRKEAVHHAAAYPRATKYLINYEKKHNGVYVDPKDKRGRFPIICAVEDGNVDSVKVFIDYYVSELSASICAEEEEKKVKVRQYLKEAGKGDRLKTPFIAASMFGKVEIMKYLVEEWGVSVNETDKEGLSGLHHAAMNGKLKAVEYLVEHAAGYNASARNGCTPLDCAFGKETSLYGHAFLLSEKVKIQDYLTNLGAQRGNQSPRMTKNSSTYFSSIRTNQQNNDKSVGELLSCKVCGNTFPFNVKEQHSYQQKGWDKPVRCFPCRQNKKAASAPTASPSPRYGSSEGGKFSAYKSSDSSRKW